MVVHLQKIDLHCFVGLFNRLFTTCFKHQYNSMHVSLYEELTFRHYFQEPQELIHYCACGSSSKINCCQT